MIRKRVSITVALALAGSVVLGGSAAQAKSSTCLSERKAIEVAENAYRAKNGRYTTVGELLTAHVLGKFPARYVVARVNTNDYLIIPLQGTDCSGKVVRS